MIRTGRARNHEDTSPTREHMHPDRVRGGRPGKRKGCPSSMETTREGAAHLRAIETAAAGEAPHGVESARQTQIGLAHEPGPRVRRFGQGGTSRGRCRRAVCAQDVPATPRDATLRTLCPVGDGCVPARDVRAGTELATGDEDGEGGAGRTYYAPEVPPPRGRMPRPRGSLARRGWGHRSSSSPVMACGPDGAAAAVIFAISAPTRASGSIARTLARPRSPARGRCDLRGTPGPRTVGGQVGGADPIAADGSRQGSRERAGVPGAAFFFSRLRHRHERTAVHPQKRRSRCILTGDPLRGRPSVALASCAGRFPPITWTARVSAGEVPLW